MQTRKSPAATSANRAELSDIQQPEVTVQTLAAQVISKKFGIDPIVAALVASLAGIGEKGARA